MWGRKQSQTVSWQSSSDHFNNANGDDDNDDIGEAAEAGTLSDRSLFILGSDERELNLLYARDVDRLHALVDFDEEAQSWCSCDGESSET